MLPYRVQPKVQYTIMQKGSKLRGPRSLSLRAVMMAVAGLHHMMLDSTMPILGAMTRANKEAFASVILAQNSFKFEVMQKISESVCAL